MQLRSRASADFVGLPLYLYLGGFNAKELPTPQSDEEFNALNPGDYYIDPDDGKTYRK